jgi:hypothetical protein
MINSLCTYLLFKKSENDKIKLNVKNLHCKYKTEIVLVQFQEKKRKKNHTQSLIFTKKCIRIESKSMKSIS